MNGKAENADVLRVQNLEVVYPRAHGGGQVHAVRDVSFSLRKHESLGLVGESGCGKSSIAGAVMGLNPVTGGHVQLGGDARGAGGREGRLRRSRKIQIVFQDPLGALNPRMRIGQALEEVLRVHGIGENRSERMQRVAALLTRVGLPLSVMSRYPHEISGGQRQRVGIARAISLEPDVLIADEPVSALDVSVQVQILNLLKSLQTELGMAILFISHDLASVRYLCERVMVMYLGAIVEEGSADRLFQRPSHPYTHALLSAVPQLEKKDRVRQEQAFMLKGELPSHDEAVRGCSFHPRCPLAVPECEVRVPDEVAVHAEQRSRCHFADRIAKNGIAGIRPA